jgi:hypothetical protein
VLIEIIQTNRVTAPLDRSRWFGSYTPESFRALRMVATADVGPGCVTIAGNRCGVAAEGKISLESIVDGSELSRGDPNAPILTHKSLTYVAKASRSAATPRIAITRFML